MARAPAAMLELPFLTRRMVEWGILALVVLALAGVFVYRMQSVQAQAEGAAVGSTLGALRTAFVLDHLQRQAHRTQGAVADIQHNPFELLERQPTNYRGAMSFSQADSLPAGSWIFDPACACIGYLPIWPQWFDSPSGDVMAWFHIHGDPGPLQITPNEAYAWHGVLLR